MVDSEDAKVYVYNASGAYQSTRDFDLNSDNDDPTGITWDGLQLYVPDATDNKVYVYDADGTYQASLGFALTSLNGSPGDITWDGTHLRVLDLTATALKVYTYTALGAYVGNIP